MEEKGVFRTSLGGFRKADVLNYIDTMTAEWNEERQQLTQDAARFREESEKAKEAVQQAAEIVNQSEEARLQAEKKADAMAEQVAHLSDRLEALREQLKEAEEKVQTATTEMMAAEERLSTRERELQQKDEQLSQLKEQQEQYETMLGQCDNWQEHVGDVVRPFMETASRRATAVVDDTQAVIASLREQLEHLASGLEEKKQSILRDKDENDNRLTDVLADWFGQAKAIAKDAGDRASHFFR